jgi:hypothetical protein
MALAMKTLKSGKWRIILTSFFLTFILGLIGGYLSEIQAQARRSVEFRVGPTPAYVTHLTGEAGRSRTGETGMTPLKPGDSLGKGDEVLVGPHNSRLEITLADKTSVRFAANTRLKIIQLEPEENSLVTRINLVRGQSYANLRRLTGRADFAITTENAVAGVRGSIYRLDAAEDKSVLVRVYEGRVQVSAPPRVLAPPQPVGPPGRIAGPHPVPGPKPVSMAEWTFIVGARQQMRISPEGRPEPIETFPEILDLDDWVRWNQERDALLDSPERKPTP